MTRTETSPPRETDVARRDGAVGARGKEQAGGEMIKVKVELDGKKYLLMDENKDKKCDECPLKGRCDSRLPHGLQILNLCMAIKDGMFREIKEAK